jgi:Secretion system C-terminal sorting domain
MIYNMKILLFITLLFCGSYVKSQDTLTMMAYNILNYPLSNATKADTLKTIIKYVQPDIFMITELTSGAGAATILNDALNVDGITSYQAATYVNGTDTDNMLYYNSDKLVLHNEERIITALRDINEYVLYYKAAGMTAATDTAFIYCYMAHLKAGQTGLNPQKRNQESVSLKLHMDSHTGSIENVILGGDFNFYDSSIPVEPAYNTILNGGNISLFDPISTPGAWNNNSSFANVHTQSTRSGTIGDGGSFGGMDDRFDFIFVTNDVLSGANGLTYIPNSYSAVGNDGNHFNQSINSGTNNSAPANVIDALYIMSDHLPIIMKAYLPFNVGIEEGVGISEWKGYLAKDVFKFSSNHQEKNIEVFVYDLLGKTVLSREYKSVKSLTLNMSGLKSGLYFVKITSQNHQESFKVFNQ